MLDAELLEILEHALEDLQDHPGRCVVMAGPRQPAELVRLLGERFEAPAEDLARDVSSFLSALSSRQLIEQEGETC